MPNLNIGGILKNRPNHVSARFDLLIELERVEIEMKKIVSALYAHTETKPDLCYLTNILTIYEG